MSSSLIGILIAIFTYLVAVVAIGLRLANKNKNTDDFFLGGRKLGPFVTAMSAEASDMSSWLLMGLPGVAYVSGLADPFWTALGLAVGTYFNWLIVAKRLRTYTVVCKNSTTIPAFFANRYRDDKKILSIIAAIVIIVFFVPYTASGFAACGKLFSMLFGTSYFTAMVVSAAVIVAYTTLGGFLAASTTDFMQSIVMTIAIIVVMGYGVVTAGGMGAVMDNAHSMAGYFSLTSMFDAAGNTAAPYGFLTICSTLAWGLGYFGMPHVLLRFMAIEEPSKLKLSRRIASVWVVISMGIAIMIGIIGNAMTKAGVIEELADSETIIIAIARKISEHGILAALVAGLILAGILAATMSTADSQLLAAASSVSKDILKDAALPNMSEVAEMIYARTSVILVSVIAVIIASNPDSSVFQIVSFAWAGFGAAFGSVMILALFWKRSNKWGAICGMFTGGAMVFIWKFLVRPLGGAWNIYELLPAFLIALLVNVAVSLMTKAPSQDITDEFDAVTTACKN